MAKLGEGDARWIVKDLGEEGKNVGGWHWQDQNVLEWCKSQLAQMFSKEGAVIYSDSECNVQVTKTKVEGEATVMNRKNKLLALYDLTVTLDWTATYKDQKDIKGTIHSPNVAEENDASDFDFSVTLDSSSSKHTNVKEIVRKSAVPKVRSTLATFIKLLREGANAKEKYAAWQKSNNAPSTPVTPNNTQSFTPALGAPATPQLFGKDPPKPASTEKVELEYEFRTTPEELYQCFVDEKRVSIYTKVCDNKYFLQVKAPAKIEAKVGGKFSYLNGMIQGEFLELQPGKKLVQKLRFGDWPENCYSTLTLEFTFEKGDTVLRLKQTGAPKEDLNGNPVKPKLEQGWNDRFFIPIKLVFGYGSLIPNGIGK